MTKTKALALILSLVASALNSRADDYLQTLRRIVDNSTALSTARSLTGAEAHQNLTGLTLENPEVEASYQWGSPSAATPDKKTLDVSQSFDLAVISGARKAVAKAENNVLYETINLTRTEIASLADNLMTEAVFRSRLAAWFRQTLAQYDTLRKSVERNVELGEMTIIDLNAVKMEQLSAQTEAKLNLAELEGAVDRLKRMARGKELNWTADQYMEYSLPGDFDQWCRDREATDPEIAAARSRLEVERRKISLAKREGLPTFSLGYTSEMVTGANYHGVKIGVSLPLWANKGRVKAAKSAEAAALTALDDTAYDYVANLRTRYGKAAAMLSLFNSVSDLHHECDITEALAKMAAKGNLPLHEYLAQLQGIRELDRRVIEAEHDYQTALVELRAGRIL